VCHAKKTPIQMSRLIKYILILLIGFLLFGFVPKSRINDKDCKIKIQWIADLKGDFDFRTKWSYPEGVYRNAFGQLSCDGFCPEGTESMKDSVGKIYADSLTRFYQLVDTTHQHHSILCEAWCYEMDGTDFITAKKTNKNRINCYTLKNAGTHCSLILDITNDICIPRIELNSISSPGLKTFFCKSGFIKIDKDLMIRGIIKAEFNFDFDNTDEPYRKIFWKGKIYTTID
jgi:hypothetical protein